MPDIPVGKIKKKVGKKNSKECEVFKKQTKQTGECGERGVDLFVRSLEKKYENTELIFEPKEKQF